jgi:hypothetical protein
MGVISYSCMYVALLKSLSKSLWESLQMELLNLCSGDLSLILPMFLYCIENSGRPWSGKVITDSAVTKHARGSNTPKHTTKSNLGTRSFRENVECTLLHACLFDGNLMFLLLSWCVVCGGGGSVVSRSLHVLGRLSQQSRQNPEVALSNPNIIFNSK